MGEMLSRLGNDTLPQVVVEMFTHWCIWGQARPALVTVLHRANLNNLAETVMNSHEARAIIQIGSEANTEIKALRVQADPLGMSAAEAATFEFTRMAGAVGNNTIDAETVAFFAARVCGWAGWAATDFTDPNAKRTSEARARDEQEQQLQQLVNEHTASAG
ncbi:MAG: hypothetical protein ACOCYT_04135 [Chloroflexota bacterium]